MALETMDIAQRVELAIMEKYKPNISVMERGDSAVQQFYRGAVVFITGASGFLGMQLIEKLFRSCEITKLYMLLRPKKGKTVEQRLINILKDPLYDTLRQKKPNFADSIVAVKGDIAEVRLGVSDKDWASITNEANIIIHMAATVNFDEPLHVAGTINVRGTREMLALGKQCANLKLFTHVSTAFAHATEERINTDVKEEFYPCPLDPDVFIEMVESIEKDRLTSITPALIKGWPNTYTFTKAIAEQLVRQDAGNLPVCVVKPPLVTNSLAEPTPGWMDSKTIMSSPVGFLLGIGLGLLHVLLAERSQIISYAPLDYVNNAIITAGWDSVQNRRLWESIPMYTVSSSPYKTKWGMFGDLLRKDEFYRLSTPKMMWYSYLIETNNMLIYWLLTWFLHYVPGYFLDAVVDMLGVRPKGVPSLVKVYTKVYKLTMVYRYFMMNYWNFCNDNLVAMIARLSPADKAIYNCDVSTIDVKEQVQACVVGIRRYIVKDGLQGSEAAYRKQKMLYYANIVFMSVYLYLIWRVVYFFYSTLTMLFAL